MVIIVIGAGKRYMDEVDVKAEAAKEKAADAAKAQVCEEQPPGARIHTHSHR